jgi:hypothetical protein
MIIHIIIFHCFGVWFYYLGSKMLDGLEIAWEIFTIPIGGGVRDLKLKSNLETFFRSLVWEIFVVKFFVWKLFVRR